MIQTIILSFLFFIIITAAMAIGAIIAGKKISGSCGGLGPLGLNCFFCSKKEDCAQKEDCKDQERLSPQDN